MKYQKIIATDLDRTLLPNGKDKLSKGSYELFNKLVKKNKIKLIFVSGRPKESILNSLKKYKIPKPLFCISNVGTIIYEYKKGRLVEYTSWTAFLEKTKEFNDFKIKEKLKEIKDLTLQEKRYLNKFKVSSYLKNLKKKDIVLKEIKKKLKNTSYTLIYSVDENTKLGLIDVMHKNANKIEALTYLIEKIKINKKNILVAGDSGNDFSMLLSGLKGVLVNNSSKDVKNQLKKQVRKKGLEKKVYFAKGFEFESISLNGNYVSGIIEGAKNFGFF